MEGIFRDALNITHPAFNLLNNLKVCSTPYLKIRLTSFKICYILLISVTENKRKKEHIGSATTKRTPGMDSKYRMLIAANFDTN
jgi:hypothetical protein